jgi:mannose-6-phosphate isomerase-like protein (cupin superfamily)
MENFYSVAHVLEDIRKRNFPYLEFIRVPSMSCGVYALSAGADDLQRPHKSDEIYYVVSGTASMVLNSNGAESRRAIAAGDVIFVAGGNEHRFIEIEHDLVVLVIFAPPEG